MRTLYLIRHGQPVYGGSHTCSYSEDVPLDCVGEQQARNLGDWARTVSLRAVFSSPLTRCVQTARHLGLPVQTAEALREVDTGLWTGLSFQEISARFPAEYAQRGRHLGTTAPPGGESFAQAGARMARAIAPLLEQTEGDLAIVAHGGINRGWLCRLLERDPDEVMSLPQPWGGISAVSISPEGWYAVQWVGRMPERQPGPLLLEALLQRYPPPEGVLAHGEAVARQALELAGRSERPADRRLLHAACLLHDLVRDRPNHPQACGELLAREGYPELGAIVSLHHDLPQGAGPEASLLYLADKLVRGVERVTLAQRFEAARRKCTTPEAIAAWETRYRRAREIAAEFHLE